MSRIRTGLLANYLGKALGFLIIAAATPLLIRYLGVANYGVVGLVLTIQSLVSLFDFGLSATLQRELARRSGLPSQLGQTVAVARRLEGTYWALAVTIGVVLVATSPWIAHSWINADSPATLALPLALAGIGIAASLPVGFYAAGLTALQHQVLANSLYVFGSVLKMGGGVLIAAVSKGSLLSFFIWTTAAAGVSAVIHAIVFHRSLPDTKPEHLTDGESRAMWRFTFGVSTVSVGLLLISQVDKLLVSRMVRVEDFAYYSLAGTVVGGLYLLYQPVAATFSPKLAQAFGAEDHQRVRALYHTSNQILAATVCPAAVVVGFFSHEVLLLWTWNPLVAMNSAPLVVALMPGALAGAAVYMPFSLLRAAGWTTMPARVLFVTLAAMVPTLLYTAINRGAVGAAMVWSFFVVLQSLTIVWLMHRRLLIGEMRHWLIRDMGLPLASAITACLACRFWFPAATSSVAVVQQLTIASMATFGAAILATQTTRSQTFDLARRVVQGPDALR